MTYRWNRHRRRRLISREEHLSHQRSVRLRSTADSFFSPSLTAKAVHSPKTLVVLRFCSQVPFFTGIGCYFVHFVYLAPLLRRHSSIANFGESFSWIISRNHRKKVQFDLDFPLESIERLIKILSIRENRLDYAWQVSTRQRVLKSEEGDRVAGGAVYMSCKGYWTDEVRQATT